MSRKKRKLPTNFGPVKALPIPLFAEADESHPQTVRRRIAKGELETIPALPPHYFDDEKKKERLPNDLLVKLTDAHRERFQALADLNALESDERSDAPPSESCLASS